MQKQVKVKNISCILFDTLRSVFKGYDDDDDVGNEDDDSTIINFKVKAMRFPSCQVGFSGDDVPVYFFHVLLLLFVLEGKRIFIMNVSGIFQDKQGLRFEKLH